MIIWYTINISTVQLNLNGLKKGSTGRDPKTDSPFKNIHFLKGMSKKEKTVIELQ